MCTWLKLNFHNCNLAALVPNMVAKNRTMCDIKWHPKALITSIVFGVSSITQVCISEVLHVIFRLNSLIPMSDQVWISPYNINTISSNENKEKYRLGDDLLIQYQILQTNIIRIVWQIERRLLMRSCYKMAKNSTKENESHFYHK